MMKPPWWDPQHISWPQIRSEHRPHPINVVLLSAVEVSLCLSRMGVGIGKDHPSVKGSRGIQDDSLLTLDDQVVIII